jgi:hypothetical protein
LLVMTELERTGMSSRTSPASCLRMGVSEFKGHNWKYCKLKAKASIITLISHWRVSLILTHIEI